MIWRACWMSNICCHASAASPASPLSPLACAVPPLYTQRRGGCPRCEDPASPPRTDRTRLVPPPVPTRHVSGVIPNCTVAHRGSLRDDSEGRGRGEEAGRGGAPARRCGATRSARSLPGRLRRAKGRGAQPYARPLVGSGQRVAPRHARLGRRQRRRRPRRARSSSPRGACRRPAPARCRDYRSPCSRPPPPADTLRPRRRLAMPLHPVPSPP